jgi:hypothetical protein
MEFENMPIKGIYMFGIQYGKPNARAPQALIVDEADIIVQPCPCAQLTGQIARARQVPRNFDVELLLSVCAGRGEDTVVVRFSTPFG